MAQFPNYLLSHRKSSTLSQEEVAFLLGTQSGASVSRYEQFARVPSLETAVAFEVIYQRPVSELFGGMYQKVQHDVAVRAQALKHKDRGKPNRRARRQQVLSSIASKPINQTT